MCCIYRRNDSQLLAPGLDENEIDFRTDIVEGEELLIWPPLLETQIASAPDLRDSIPSSLFIIPLITSGNLVRDFISYIVNLGNLNSEL